MTLALSALCSLCLTLAPPQELPKEPTQKPGVVELIRDHWGIPHVYADSDAGAMYGLGYATAEDRGFQIYLELRTIQGRLAEVIGNRKKRNRNKGGALLHDRKMRSFGYWRHALAVAPKLDADSRLLLGAYCDGVNAVIQKQPEKRSAMFARFGLEPEPWTPAGCLVTWWHVAAFFGTDGTRDLISWRNQGNPRGRRRPAAVEPDDAAAVVRREDVSREWMAKVQAFAEKYGPENSTTPGNETRKFSHAWVVGGKRTTTGSAVLVSDPQTPVTNPSLFYEFHVSGKTFNARGIGVPGSPILLIGFNEHVAWGVTALGADQSDLFRLQTDPDRPDQYLFDGKWRKMNVRREKILVRGAESVTIRIRETHLGPVMTRFCFAQRGEPEVALRRVPLCDQDVDSVQGSFGMMRARNVREFWQALGRWRFPSMNAVFGDRKGEIGYSVAGAFPLRSRQAINGGRAAHDGSKTGFAWQGFVPWELVPHVFNPKRGFLLSANHRPVQSFYPLYLGNMTGSLGDTLRSWRLRELLTAKRQNESYTPLEVLAVHLDTVNPARRDIVHLALHLRDKQHKRLTEEAKSALAYLEDWHAKGASSDLRAPGSELATLMNLGFRRPRTPLTEIHGGGLSGLSRFLRTTAEKVRSLPGTVLDEDHVDYIDSVLSDAWMDAGRRYGRETAAWNARARRGVSNQRLGYYSDLDGFPSLDPEADLQLPALTCMDRSTIQSQKGQSYTQWVPMHDVDQARSILPIGASEDPDSDTRLSTLELWSKGKLHLAPLSRQAVEKIKTSARKL